MNNTLNLQGERLGLFNPITGLDNKSFAKVKRMSKGLSTISNEERWNRTARKEARAIYAWHKKNIGINTADKFVNGILTNDRNKKSGKDTKPLPDFSFFTV